MSKQPYTYTVLRYVHDTGTGEFANVGVVLTSPDAGYADAILRPTYGRLSKMFPGMDGDHFRRVIRHLQSRFDEISARVREEMDPGDRPANALDLAHRVIAADDSSFQWSTMGSGLAEDLPATLESIYRRMVELYDEKTKTESRNDEEVWRSFRKSFEERRILSRLHQKVIAVQDDEITFDHAWKNHLWHCIESVSFDLMQAKSIKDKAHNWLGRITSVKDTMEDFRVYFLVGEPQLEGSRKAFDQALNVLHKAPVGHEIIRENEAGHFAADMATRIAAHDAEVSAESQG
jgi:hypothetical protein